MKKKPITLRYILGQISKYSFVAMVVCFFISWKIINTSSVTNWDIAGTIFLMVSLVSGIWYLFYDGSDGTKIGPPGYPF